MNTIRSFFPARDSRPDIPPLISNFFFHCELACKRASCETRYLSVHSLLSHSLTGGPNPVSDATVFLVRLGRRVLRLHPVQGLSQHAGVPEICLQVTIRVRSSRCRERSQNGINSNRAYYGIPVWRLVERLLRQDEAPGHELSLHRRRFCGGAEP